MTLFLVGFMAAGKTSVAQAIASRGGFQLCDLDDEIAALGEPPASLVERDEPELRRREARVLADLCEQLARPGARARVVATGGGAAAYGDNLARMRAHGLVVALGVDVAEARRRAQGDAPARPLLARAETLAAQRAPIYRRAHAVVDTMGRSVAEVAAAVLEVERVWRTVPADRRDTITILALGDRSYPITVTAPIDTELVHGVVGTASRVAIVTDTNVRPHAERVARAWPGAPIVEIAPGEASKSFAVFERVCGELIGHGLDRGSAIVAVGGGVVGDLAGFVAASLFRGISVVQVPTTIVAMTDAAIGGKTAIDLPAGKNLVGAFWQPRLVACATETLSTLPGRERRAGFGELWKYALLDGRDLWSAVAGCAPWAGREPANRAEAPDVPAELLPVIHRAIAYKAAIVGRDERERTGHRALLNLGHTVGHAIEAATGMLHGEAVGLGLVAACRVSAAVSGASPALEAEVTEALARTGLPTELDRYLDDATLERLVVDKKRVGHHLRFIVIREVGGCEPLDIPLSELRRILRPVRGT